MTINKEGFPLIGLVAAGSAAAAVFAYRLCSPWLAAIAAIGFVKAGFFCYFFRDPERIIPDGTDVLLSPADGKVMEIADEDGGRKTIRIFLSVVNVHLQRSPASGVVKAVERTGTKYLPAMKSAAHGENVRNIITMETAGGSTIQVHQIVGILARRLVLWIKPGDKLAAGERIGIIKFGSQVDLTFPSGYEPVVKPGDKVTGGTSVIARKTPRTDAK
ncbi:MAG: phosphatidylserine decarboxylase family protein [Elusimicrobia bacterium HGW-Elusimicrobia-1]|jgi:phosphatidylserine decarboxylase|nr:MAG: phosphatidylserine decarboxylase family protein [Elusimicrobia bacterium HGW-Elusimicrobia-1]